MFCRWAPVLQEAFIAEQNKVSFVFKINSVTGVEKLMRQ